MEYHKTHATPNDGGGRQAKWQRTWARAQRGLELLAINTNEFIAPLFVPTSGIGFVNMIIFLYALIKLPKPLLLGALLAFGSGAYLLFYHVAFNEVCTLYDLSTDALRARRQHLAKGRHQKYWRAHTRSYRPFILHMGAYCGKFTRGSNTVLWRAALDILLQVLLVV